jgi:hypothetical protein
LPYVLDITFSENKNAIPVISSDYTKTVPSALPRIEIHNGKPPYLIILQTDIYKGEIEFVALDSTQNHWKSAASTQEDIRAVQPMANFWNLSLYEYAKKYNPVMLYNENEFYIRSLRASSYVMMIIDADGNSKSFNFTTHDEGTGDYYCLYEFKRSDEVFYKKRAYFYKKNTASGAFTNAGCGNSNALGCSLSTIQVKKPIAYAYGSFICSFRISGKKISSNGSVSGSGITTNDGLLYNVSSIINTTSGTQIRTDYGLP